MPTPLAIRIAFWLWIFAAVGLSQTELLQRRPLLTLLAVLSLLTTLLVLAYRTIAAFREWVDALDLRGIVLLHLTRLVGFYFILLYRRGELPYAFAIPGGIGDIAVALAAPVIAFVPMADTTRHRAIYIWNVVGLVDILLIVMTAARIGLSGSHELRALAYLPLSLLPTFLVPLIIATHLAIFARLQRAQP